MTVSHKGTFFDNIASYDERAIAREVRRLLAANTAENRHFSMDRYRRELANQLSPEKVARVMEAVSRPYEGEVKVTSSPTGADQAREQRKALKRNMRSRRR